MEDDGAHADPGVLADLHAVADAAADAQVRTFPDLGARADRGGGCNVSVVADRDVLFHEGRRVDDRVSTDLGTGIHHRAGEHDDTGIELCRGRD